jgi:hypothetical protein
MRILIVAFFGNLFFAAFNAYGWLHLDFSDVMIWASGVSTGIAVMTATIIFAEVS